jgi:hypothetical protein
MSNLAFANAVARVVCPVLECKTLHNDVIADIDMLLAGLLSMYPDTAIQSLTIAMIYIKRMAQALRKTGSIACNSSYYSNGDNDATERFLALCASSITRPLLAALILAGKYWESRVFAQNVWCECMAMSVRCVNELEWLFFQLIDFDLAFDELEYRTQLCILNKALQSAK